MPKKSLNSSPFICYICDLPFNTKTKFKLHKRIHIGLKVFPCPNCDKEFKDGYSLKRHSIQLHHRDRLPKCDICGHTFNCNDYLKVHRLSHFEKNGAFVCKICDKGYHTRSGLKRHNEDYHTETQCPICLQMFETNVVYKGKAKLYEKLYECNIINHFIFDRYLKLYLNLVS